MSPSSLLVCRVSGSAMPGCQSTRSAFRHPSAMSPVRKSELAAGGFEGFELAVAGLFVAQPEVFVDLGGDELRRGRRLEGRLAPVEPGVVGPNSPRSVLAPGASEAPANANPC